MLCKLGSSICRTDFGLLERLRNSHVSTHLSVLTAGQKNEGPLIVTPSVIDLAKGFERECFALYKKITNFKITGQILARGTLDSKVWSALCCIPRTRMA
jgi:hypothetical protein